jgi:hypothetical protein
MKTLEANSIRIGKTDGERAGMKILSNLGANAQGWPHCAYGRYHLM